jgi:hypothetical protein
LRYKPAAATYPLRHTVPALQAPPVAGSRRFVPAARQLANAPQFRRDADDPVRRISFVLGLCLLFVRVSMIHEVITAETGINSRLLYIVGIPFLLTIPGSGAWGRTFHKNRNWAWIGFIVWMSMATLLSTWVGGSVDHTIYYLRTTAPLLLVTGGLAVSLCDCGRIMNTVACAGIVNVLSSRLFAYKDAGGRDSLDFGTIANSNDLAAHLLLVLPFLLYLLMKPKSGVITKCVSAAAMAWGAYSILATGSRGALIALLVTVLVALWKGSMAQRMAIVVALGLGAASLIAVLPHSTLNRLTSFSSGQDTASGEAAASAETRTYLSYQSLMLTMRHPVFGVGPGQFSNVSGQEGKALGIHTWQETHNFFTQISSECGVPALIFYLITVVSALITTNRILTLARRRPDLGELRVMSFCLLLAMTGFGVASLFLNMAYQFYWLLLTGLATSVARCARNENMATATDGV